jgi:hypothetical protein
VIKEKKQTSEEEIDDGYLPACCRKREPRTRLSEFLNQTVVVGGTVRVHPIIEFKVPLVIFDPWRAPLDVISLIERG